MAGSDLRAGVCFHVSRRLALVVSGWPRAAGACICIHDCAPPQGKHDFAAAPAVYMHTVPSARQRGSAACGIGNALVPASCFRRAGGSLLVELPDTAVCAGRDAGVQAHRARRRAEARD